VTTFVPTTTVSVLRGTTTDGYGDETDAGTVVVAGVAAAIQERFRTVYGRGSDQDRIVRYSACRVPFGTDVRDDDRIRDDATSVVYAIDELHSNTSPVHPADVVMRLRRIT
jgi:hypothetical protein